MLLDVEYLKNLSEEKHKELKGLEKKILELAGREFNINSPKQMGEVFICKAGARQAKPKKQCRSLLHQCFPAYQTERNSSDN